MKAPDILLVGTDLSEPADHTVANAAMLAGRLGLRLRVLHVIDTMDLEPTDWPREGEVESKLEELTARFPEDLKVELKIEEGDTNRSILREADKPEVAALVVGYSGKSGFFQRIGSTAAKVARRSQKPTFILTTSFTKKCTVIGCLDFSETSLAVLEWTHRLTKVGGFPGHFAHVALPLKRLIQYNLGDGDDDSPIPTFGGSEKRYESRLESALRRRYDLEGDEVEIEFDDSPQSRLEDISASWYPALLVLGRTEHNALHDRLLGSTAEQILDYSNCSTLIVAGKVSTF